MEKNIVIIALFAALIAALGLVPKFTLASGIPITAQSMGIMLCGTVLGSRRGAKAVLLFLLLVADWPIFCFRLPGMLTLQSSDIRRIFQ